MSELLESSELLGDSLEIIKLIYAVISKKLDKITYPENCKGFYLFFGDSEVRSRYFGLNSEMLDTDFFEEMEYCFRLLCIYKRHTDKICVAISSLIQSPETLDLFSKYADSKYLGLISSKTHLFNKQNKFNYFKEKTSRNEFKKLKNVFPYNRYFDSAIQNTVSELLSRKVIAIIGVDAADERKFANAWVKMVNDSYNSLSYIINDEFVDAILGSGKRFVWEHVDSELEKRKVNYNSRCGALDLILKCYLNQFKPSFIFPSGFSYNNVDIDNKIGSELNYFNFPDLKKRHEYYEDKIKSLTPNQFIEFVTSKKVYKLKMYDGCGPFKLMRFNHLLKKYCKKADTKC